MLYLPIFALLGTPALGEEARTYEYSDDRLFTVVFSGSDVQHIATTKTTITGKTSTRERTFLTFTGEGARPTGEASLNDTDETDPELDAEDLYSSDDDGIFIAMHEDEEGGSANSEASSEASASDSGALGSGASASGSGSETSGASGSETSGSSGSETSGSSGSETSGSSGSETSGSSGSKTSGSATSGSASSESTSGNSGSGGSSSETPGNNGATLSNGLGAFFAAAALALL